jgi:nucleoside 2-deoxyribosyltransferase
MTEKLIYCSGPMFSPGDLDDQAAVAQTLEAAGYATYLPQRDGLQIGLFLQVLDNPVIDAATFSRVVDLVRKAVFAMDTYQVIGNSRAVVFNMNGRVPDEGSVVEVTMAYLAGLPLVIYKDTPITAEGKYDNPMVQGLSATWDYATTYTAIVPALAARLADPSNGNYVYVPPPTLATTVAIGEKVQAMRDMIDRVAVGGLNGPDLLKAVQQLIAALEGLGLD